MTSGRGDQRQPANYEILIRGHLGPTIRRAFPALHAQTRGEDTLLRGAVADQSALHGVLSRIEALGLELLELRRLPRHPGNGRGTQARDICSPGL
ncbi:MAG: hypothetical protein ABSA02_23005 [Trebonia sp.]|jgi:hypothetical protein